MTVSAGAVFLIVQLMGGQPVMTVYATAGDCAHARDHIVAPSTAKCVEAVQHARVASNGDVDWPLAPTAFTAASYSTKTVAPAAKRPVVKRKASVKKRRHR